MAEAYGRHVTLTNDELDHLAVAIPYHLYVLDMFGVLFRGDPAQGMIDTLNTLPAFADRIAAGAREVFAAL